MRPVVVAALAYVLVVRVLELTLSRRNRARVLGRGGRAIEPDGFGAIAAVHTAWIVGLALEEVLLGPSIGSSAVRAAAGAAFALSELVRLWCIATLGDRWNVRVVVEDRPPLRTGPYALLRHPNYAAASLGLLALPLALGLVWTAAAALPLKLWSLRGRLRVEQTALGAARRSRG